MSINDLPTQCEVDAPCQPLSTPCHSSCPHGHLLVDDDHCVLQENLCPEAEQCVHDEDCQDNAGCLLSGTVRYIHFVKKCPQVMATLYLSLPSMIKSTIQPGDGLPVLPQLCCHTFKWDLPKDRSLHQCSWCCSGYSFRSSNIYSIGKITEIRKRKFCLKAVFIFQGGQLPPCYEQGDVKICPFSFAKFGDVVFDYTQVGNGFGPYTYNGILLKATYSHS